MKKIEKSISNIFRLLAKGAAALLIALPVITCSRSDFAETFRLCERFSYASQNSVVKRKKQPFEIGSYNLRGKNHVCVVQNFAGSITFYEHLSKKAILKFRLAGKSPKPGRVVATAEIQSDFPNRKARSHRAFIGKEFSMDLPEFSGHVVAVTLSARGPTMKELQGPLFWLDPIIEEDRNTTRGRHTASRLIFEQSHHGNNVLIFLFDALNAFHVGSYGYPKNTTPNIDSIAKEGVVWENAYTQAAYTIASVGTLFTGLYPDLHKVLKKGQALPESYITMAERFQESGYDTALFTASPNASPLFGYGQGFRKVWMPKAPVIRANDFIPDLKEWLSSVRNRSFFGYVHFREPHFPFEPPEKFLKRFQTDLNFPLPINDKSIVRSQEEKDKITAAYDANLAFVDEQFGRIVQYLRITGLLEKTVLIILSDHGEAFWEHGIQGHNNTVYEEVARVPFVIRFPNEPRLRDRRREIVQTMSIFPTLLNLLGLSRKGLHLSEESLLPFLWNQEPSRERIAYSQTAGRDSLAIRSSNFRFIERTKSRDPDELYQDSSDPQEKNNMIDMYPILASYYRSLLHEKLNEMEKAKSYFVSTPRQATIDQGMEQQLKALGYVQ